MTLLSLLICHHPAQSWRKETLRILLAQIAAQTNGIEDQIELLVDAHGGSIGVKRNRLLQSAQGLYTAFIDDDDQIGPNYILQNLDGMLQDADCCSLTGIITDDGQNPRKFIHSLRYDSWFETGEGENMVYYRMPNHLNCIRASIAKQITFPEKSHGEDHDFSKTLQKSGLLKTEHYIEEPIYFYNHVSNKNR